LNFILKNLATLLTIKTTWSPVLVPVAHILIIFITYYDKDMCSFFQAIEKKGYNYNLNMSSLTDHQRQSMGLLLSQLFCKRWDTLTEGGKDSLKILSAVLTWGPMKVYISNFCMAFFVFLTFFNKKCNAMCDVLLPVFVYHPLCILHQHFQTVLVGCISMSVGEGSENEFLN